jgi:hypothetical protein
MDEHQETLKTDQSATIAAKHEEAKRAFPFLNLSAGEYVLRVIERHSIGVFIPIGVTILFIALTLSFMINYPLIVDSTNLMIRLPSANAVWLMGGALCLLFAVGGYAAVWVYQSNRLYITSESVIQEIQVSLFSRHEQTVGLGKIEDVSYSQSGVMALMFNYGIIRLSTVGEEHTYRITYVSNPKEVVAQVNNIVEEFNRERIQQH